MSHNDQNQQLQVLDVVWNSALAEQSKDTAEGPYLLPPPPNITHEDNPEKVSSSAETKFKGHGFWRGCCAGWCCYCCLDMCF